MSFGPWNAVPPALGVIHLRSLPGSPRARLGFDACLEAAQADALAYRRGGIDGLVVENHGDAPFAKDLVEPHVTAFLAIAARELRREHGVPVGINCLRNDAAAALGAAAAAGVDFIRVNVLVGVVATDQGVIEGAGASLLRYRRALEAEDVAIVADVHVKFATPLYDPGVAELALTALTRGGADAVIITGSRTGEPPDPQELRRVRERIGGRGPLLLGSGLDLDNVAVLAPLVDGVIVGSSCKRGGDPDAAVDGTRVRALMTRLQAVRSSVDPR